MPSKTPKQARFFAMLSHNPKLAKARGVDPKVAREFNAADQGTKLLARANQKPAKRGGRGRGQRN